MLKTLLPCVLTVLVAPVWAQTGEPDSCGPLRERIEANIASKGVVDFMVTVVDADVSAPGEQVGTCGNGKRKIMYLKAAGASAPVGAQPNAPRPAVKEPLLTECKDGTVSMGGTCKP